MIELGCDIGLREGRNRVIPFTYKISDFMKVVGLYISEGHLVCNLGERGVSFGFGISQLYSNSEYIFDVLDSFGIKYTYNVNRNGMCLFTIRSKFSMIFN